MGCMVFCGVATLALAENEGAIQWGNMVLKPSTSVVGAYDDRVNLLPDDKADGDFYADIEAGLRLENLPARFNLKANAFYGYRFYDENTDSDGDFYRGGGLLASSENPFKWEIRAGVAKTLSYDTDYDPAEDNRPASIISDTPNRRTDLQGTLSYDVPLTERTALRPQYSILHYYQEFEGSSSSVNYLVHQAGLQLRRKYSEHTTFAAGGSYGVQLNNEEKGRVATVSAGVESRVTDRVTWLAELGYSYGDYEISGRDHGPVSHIRGNWTITDKVSAYVFGGNEFQPGYGDTGARLTYRLGYGVGWGFAEKMALRVSMLHDYQDEVGNNTSTDPVIGVVRHFFDTGITYQFYRRLNADLGYRYVNDEKKPDQQIVSLRLAYSY